MKNKLYIILACTLLVFSCQRETLESDKGTADTKTAAVTLTFTTVGIQMASRTLSESQENSVGELNL